MNDASDHGPHPSGRLSPIKIKNLHEAKDIADEARALARCARDANLERIEINAKQSEIWALRLLGEMLVEFTRFETDDEASVVTNDELIEFIRRHRYLAQLMAYLPDNEVTAIRQRAFNFSLGAAVQRRLAEKSAPNFARSGLARTQKKEAAEGLIRKKCETIRANRSGKWTPASYIVKNHFVEINKALNDVGLKSYCAARLVKIIGKVAPLRPPK